MRYIIFDLETTGLNTAKDEPVQVFMGSAEPDYSLFVEELQIYCYGRAKHTSEAEKVHGLSRDWLQKHGVPASSAAKQVTEFIWRNQPCILVGHNAMNFDYPMLHNWLGRYIPGRFKHPPWCGVLDTMHLLNAFRGGRKWARLDVAAKFLDIPISRDLHDAREDGLLTWKIFRRLREELKWIG